MSRIILLDAGPLGLVTNPRAATENHECNLWLQTQLRRGVRVLVPEIADYEVRRELLRAGKSRGLARLDALQQSIGYIPLTTDVMRQAAAFWAQTGQHLSVRRPRISSSHRASYSSRHTNGGASLPRHGAGRG